MKKKSWQWRRVTSKAPTRGHARIYRPSSRIVIGNKIHRNLERVLADIDWSNTRVFVAGGAVPSAR